MRRMRETQKQKLNLRNFHRLVRSSLRPSSSRIRRIVRPRNLLVGLTATVGISSLAFAAHHQAEVNSQSIKAEISSTSKSPANNNQTSATITVDNNDKAQSTDKTTAQSTDDNAQVTINNQPVPLENGTVQRTFTGSDGSTYSVDISIDSHSTSSSSNNSSTDISIDSNDSSTSGNSARGSPRH